jgi:outer membrane immunogenic protein
MKKFLMASTAIFAIPGMALAADLPAKKEASPPPPAAVAAPTQAAVAAPAQSVAASTSWSGPYIGAQLGYSSSNIGLDTTDYSFPNYFAAPSNALNQELLGGRAGYDWQFGKMVVGVVADADWRIGDRNFDVGDNIAVSTGWKAKSDWDAGSGLARVCCWMTTRFSI